MLQVLDIFFTFLHLFIIGFNLTGWAFKSTRKIHLFVVSATVACWFILGIWYGIGYCPVTDWQWQVKEQLGEHNLPGSFIKYLADKISGQNTDAELIDVLTAVSFALTVMITCYVNFIKKSPSLF
jgi:Protein of Unknown function (DUF2784)